MIWFWPKATICEDILIAHISVAFGVCQRLVCIFFYGMASTYNITMCHQSYKTSMIGKWCELSCMPFFFFLFWNKLKNQLQEWNQNTITPGKPTQPEENKEIMPRVIMYVHYWHGVNMRCGNLYTTYNMVMVVGVAPMFRKGRGPR